MSDEQFRAAMAAFDPRDPAQRLKDPASWKVSDNPALLSATLSMQLIGGEEIDWSAVARAADLYDATMDDETSASGAYPVTVRVADLIAVLAKIAGKFPEAIIVQANEEALEIWQADEHGTIKVAGTRYVRVGAVEFPKSAEEPLPVWHRPRAAKTSAPGESV